MAQDDQLRAIVQRMVERGESEDAIAQVVRAYDAQAAQELTPVASHAPSEPTPEHPHARTFRLAKENAPSIGAALGGLLTGGASLPLQALAAAGGGALGAGLRGDSAGDVATSGLKEGALQLAGGGLMKGAQAIGRGLMRGTIPKNIAKNFDDVDIAQEMLDRGVLPGVPQSANRVSRLSEAANVERAAAAQTVPPLTRRRVIEGLRPIHQKMTAAREPELAADVLAQMRRSARDIGSQGMSGADALARKDVKQALGRASLNAADPRTAALGSQLNDLERGTIVSHLRQTPRMATALDESQTLMAIDQVMKDAAHSNPITRARIGGTAAAASSPVGLGLTAHAVNQGSRALDPNVARLLLSLLGQRSDQE